jgi:hypothetical protein
VYVRLVGWSIRSYLPIYGINWLTSIFSFLDNIADARLQFGQAMTTNPQKITFGEMRESGGEGHHAVVEVQCREQDEQADKTPRPKAREFRRGQAVQSTFTIA